MECLDDVLAGERAGAGQHLGQHGAERKQIGTCVDVFPLDLLRRQVPGCSEHDTGERGEAVGNGFVLSELRDSEVEELRRTGLGQEDVFRLQIAVHQAGRVRGDEPAGDLHGNPQDFIGGNRAAGDAHPQRLTFEQLGDQIGAVLVHVPRRTP